MTVLAASHKSTECSCLDQISEHSWALKMDLKSLKEDSPELS